MAPISPQQSLQSSLQETVNVYEYSYTHIEPVAMSSRLPLSERFSSPWLVLIAQQFFKLAINTLIANRGDQGKAGVEDDVQQFLREILDRTLEEQGPALKLKLVGALIGFLPELLDKDSSPVAAYKLERGLDTAISRLLEDLPAVEPTVKPVAGSPTDADIEAAKGVEIASQQLSQGLPTTAPPTQLLRGMPPNDAALEVAKGIEASTLLQAQQGVKGASQNAETNAETAALLQNAPATLKAQVSNGVETSLQRLAQNVPKQESDIEKFVSSNLFKVLGSDFVKPFAKHLLNGLKEKAPTGRPSSLEDYRRLFAYLDLPDVADDFQDDATFAWMRVAGPNPVMIERMTAADLRFPVTEAQYQAVMGAADSLEKAMQAGRVYLADYAILDGAVNGTYGANPQAQKYLYAPLALFAVPLEGELLRPVAIQVGQDPAQYPVVTPDQGEAWLIAKTMVQIADANFHEAVSHFARTHLLIEPFVVATHRKFPATHPLFQLLRPHFQGTLAINDSAKGILVAPKGGVNRLLSATIENSRLLMVKGFRGRGFNDDMLPQRLKARGVDEAVLPVYPYRDDGLLVWQAIHDWVTAYVQIYYRSDQDVQNDVVLQAWAAELVAFDGGRVPGFGDQGRGQIETLTYLSDALTMIIFTASAQHAAVNFPQNGIMSYAPAMPTAGYIPADSDQTWLDLLPPLDQAQSQLNLLYLLGSVYFTKLGQYEANHFTDAKVAEPLKAFQQRLQEVSDIIDQRNLKRPVYEYLKPVNIPQSINI